MNQHFYKLALRAEQDNFILAVYDDSGNIAAEAMSGVYEDAEAILCQRLAITQDELWRQSVFVDEESIRGMAVTALHELGGELPESLAAEACLTLYDKAIRLLLTKHRGQTDKAGADYRLHPLRVAAGVADCDAKIVALLHDVIEDTGTTPANLASIGFPAHIIEGILSVTNQEGESYKDFVARASRNALGKQVKVSDIKDNLNIFRLRKIEAKDAVRLNKYLQCYRFLTEDNAAYLDLIE